MKPLGIAGGDIVPFDIVLVGPGQKGVRGKLAAIVADDCRRPAVRGDQSMNSRATPFPDSEVSTRAPDTRAGSRR